MTVQTSPAGRSFTVDGTTHSSTQTFSWQPGSSHTIATTSFQSGGTGVQYVWKKWSDSGSISHTVAPTTNKTYTATFTTQYYLTMSAESGGTVSPSSGWRNSGTSVSIIGTPTNTNLVSYNFTGWTGTGTVLLGHEQSRFNLNDGTYHGDRCFYSKSPKVTVQTSPAGRSFTVDSTTYSSTQTFSWQPGSSHTIATASPRAAERGFNMCGRRGATAEASPIRSLPPRTRPTPRLSQPSII